MDSLDKYQAELDEDMKALHALTTQVEYCDKVTDILKKMPDNNAWVVIGVGVGDVQPDAQINLRGLTCDYVAALLSTVKCTRDNLMGSIKAIKDKYPNGDTTGEQRPEQHIHYHFHGSPGDHWCPPPLQNPPEYDEPCEPFDPTCDCHNPFVEYDPEDTPNCGCHGGPDSGSDVPPEDSDNDDGGLNLD